MEVCTNLCYNRLKHDHREVKGERSINKPSIQRCHESRHDLLNYPNMGNVLKIPFAPPIPDSCNQDFRKSAPSWRYDR